MVTTDSAPLHIAGSLGRPAVGLFRAIRPGLSSIYPTVHAVFWDGHVGIYVGNSSVLHAPYTGTVVQITPIWPGVIGAVRPG